MKIPYQTRKVLKGVAIGVLSVALAVLVDAMAQHFDLILVDTAAGMGEPFTAAASVCDRALLVLTPDPVALRDGRIVADWLFDHGQERVQLVMNRVERSRFSPDSVRDLDECIDTVQVQLLAVVPESVELGRAAASGQPLPQGCLAFTALDNLARRVRGFQVPLAVQ